MLGQKSRRGEKLIVVRHRSGHARHGGGVHQKHDAAVAQATRDECGKCAWLWLGWVGVLGVEGVMIGLVCEGVWWCARLARGLDLLSGGGRGVVVVGQVLLQ